MTRLSLSLLAVVLASAASARDVVSEPKAPQGVPAAVVDLRTPEGVALVKGSWRVQDARIVEIPFRAAGPDGQPTGPAVTTWDVEPKAGPAEFDDSGWPVVEPGHLEDRRGPGKLSFQWYRIALTIPERIGAVDTAGATVVFEASVDDYAEVWVDGELPRRAGQQGGSVVAGFNALNRLVVGRGVKPGQRIQLVSRDPGSLILDGKPGPVAVPPQRDPHTQPHPGRPAAPGRAAGGGGRRP